MSIASIYGKKFKSSYVNKHWTHGAVAMPPSHHGRDAELKMYKDSRAIATDAAEAHMSDRDLTSKLYQRSLIRNPPKRPTVSGMMEVPFGESSYREELMRHGGSFLN